MGLEQKQTRKSVQQNKAPRHKPRATITLFLQRCQKLTLKKSPSLQQIVVAKLNVFMEKNEARSLPLTLAGINTKGNKDLNIRLETKTK